MKRAAFCILLACLLFPARAEEWFPREGWRERPNPTASPDALVGGEISIYPGPSPSSLNYYLDNNTFSAAVFGAMYESLLTDDPLTLDEVPNLAERWSISDDRKTFTFRIKPAAKWSDGRPVTAEDVQWTFQAIMDPKNLTGPYKVALEKFDPPVVLGPREIRFTTREVHWRNLNAVGSLLILPRHAFADRDFNKINFEFPVVSGPYRLGEIKSGVQIVLERRADWWAREAPFFRGVANFQRIRYKVFESRENAYDAFLKGEIDLFPIYTARTWANETVGEKFEKNWIVKQKVANYNPMGFQGFAMNMRRPPFDDGRVREALSLLLDRGKMNATLMYNQYQLLQSYFPDLYSESAPCPTPLVPFDKTKARDLLKQAGWKANAATGLLEKDGRPFAFKFLNRDSSSNKFLAIYQQDLKDVGIDLQIEIKDQASWTKDMDEYNYQMTWAAWSAAVRKDPEGMWHSKEAERHSGSNITGFKNPEVDALIEKQKDIFDIAQRHEIVRRIDRIICAEHPYVLLWNLNYARLVYWNKFGTPPAVLSKYGSEEAAPWLWWSDEDARAELDDAMQAARPLPKKEFDIRFDDKCKETAK